MTIGITSEHLHHYIIVLLLGRKFTFVIITSDMLWNYDFQQSFAMQISTNVRRKVQSIH